MARVIFRSGATLRDVRSVTVLRPGLSGTAAPARPVKVLFKARDIDNDDDRYDDEISVRIVRPNSGVVREARIDDSGPRRKRQIKVLRPFERMIRGLVKRELRMGKIYLDRHDRSNRISRNGWIKDFNKNIGRAIRQSRD